MERLIRAKHGGRKAPAYIDSMPIDNTYVPSMTMDNRKPICRLNFIEVGGITRVMVLVLCMLFNDT